MTETISVDADEPLRLVVSDGDLPAGVRTAIAARQRGSEMLGGGEQHDRSFWDGVAAAVLRRVRAIATEEFVVKEVHLKFQLEGKIFGTGISGDVDVTFVPKT